MVTNADVWLETRELGDQPAICLGGEPLAANHILAQFRLAIIDGEPWSLALLEAIRQWPYAEEVVEGRVYHYLIGGEAFDWLLLAQRLCEDAADLIPVEEVENLLFYGELPVELGPEEFKQRLGPGKYRAHLNYHYGVTIEEALQLAVAQEEQKERMAHCYRDPRSAETVHQRIYNATEVELLRRFRLERGPLPDHSLTFSEYKEFTYWLFKYRLHHCHRARVASDTKKGLAEFFRQRAWRSHRNDTTPPEEPAETTEEATILP